MAIVKPTNFGKAGLATPPSGTGGLSFTVTAGKGANFPTLVGGEYFYGVFTNAARSAYEIVKIEARSGDGFTIASGGRGLDGTSAATWTTSDIFYFATTRVMWDDVGIFKAAPLALQALTPAADKLPYFTGAAAAAVTDFSSYARTLVDDTSASAARTTLDVYSTAQVDVLSAAIAALWTTGDVKTTLKTVADTGWVMMDDGTVGDATSGGTTRANADTSALFTLLWNNTADAQCAVSTGRGANAAADFAAHKTIAMPKALGRALAAAGAGAGLTARALALIAGEETHILTVGETPVKNHTHTVTDPTHGHPGSTVTYSDSLTGGTNGLYRGNANDGQFALSIASAATGISIPSSGQDTTATGHNVLQPTLFLNFMVKL